jgi:hypothetical protein
MKTAYVGSDKLLRLVRGPRDSLKARLRRAMSYSPRRGFLGPIDQRPSPRSHASIRRREC